MEKLPRVTRTQSRIAAAVLTLLGLGYTLTAFQLPIGRPFGSGSGGTPVLIGLAWCIFGAYLTIRPPDISTVDEETGSWPAGAGLKRIVLVLALCAAFIVMMNIVGTIGTSMIFLFVMGLTFGGTFRQAFISAILLSAAFWVVFIFLLQVRLPAGIILPAIIGN